MKNDTAAPARPGQADHKRDQDDDVERPLSPREAAEEEADKLSDADRQQIVADAVQGYLRTNYITGVTLVVCERFVADALKKLRGAVQKQAGAPQSGQHPAQHQTEGHQQHKP